VGTEKVAQNKGEKKEKSGWQQKDGMGNA